MDEDYGEEVEEDDGGPRESGRQRIVDGDSIMDGFK